MEVLQQEDNHVQDRIGHEQNALPLLDANLHRSQDPSGDFSRHPPAPKLK